jgi:outer membrane scaffolding protein for murein synthesis (MipA/OmpV family)
MGAVGGFQGDMPAGEPRSRRPAAAVRRALPLCLCLFAATVLGSPAAAQTPSPLANWQFSAGEVLVKLDDEPLPEWRITLGATGSVAPRYEGADSYRPTPGGFFDIRYRDIAFFSVGEGLGVNLLRGDTYRAGVALSYDLGRDDHDDPRIRGLGDIDPAPEAKLFAQIFVLPAVLTADIRRGLGGHDGWIGDFGAYIPYATSDERFVVFAGPSVTVADSDYMESYFGVNASQAANSRLPRFDADAGLKNANFGLTALYFIDDNWFLVANAAVERLLGDAAESPITQSRTQFTVDFSVAYMF